MTSHLICNWDRLTYCQTKGGCIRSGRRGNRAIWLLDPQFPCPSNKLSTSCLLLWLCTYRSLNCLSMLWSVLWADLFQIERAGHSDRGCPRIHCTSRRHRSIWVGCEGSRTYWRGCGGLTGHCRSCFSSIALKQGVYILSFIFGFLVGGLRLLVRWCQIKFVVGFGRCSCLDTFSAFRLRILQFRICLDGKISLPRSVSYFAFLGCSKMNSFPISSIRVRPSFGLF